MPSSILPEYEHQDNRADANFLIKEPFMNYKTIFKIAVSFIFLAYVIYKTDILFLLESFLSIKPEYYLTSLFFMIINVFILAYKYKVLMRPTGICRSFFDLVKINFICRFYSVFLTSVVGQGFIRWHISTKNHEGRLRFLMVMVIERLSFLFALLLSVAISLVFVRNPHVKELSYRIYPIVIAGLLALILFFLYLISSTIHNIIDTIFSKAGKVRTGALISKAAGFARMLGLYYRKRNILLIGLLLSFIWQIFFLFRVFLLVNSMEVPLSFIQIIWMASLVFLLQVLPVSIGGIGIRETAYAFLFGLQGFPPEKGVLLGILFFTQMLLISVIGGIFHLLSKD